MSTSSSTKQKDVITRAKELAAQAKSRTGQKEEQSSVIETNPFAKILLNPETSPQDKKEELVSLMAFDKEATKEQNRSKIEAFNAFKEYLQEQRKTLNKEGIKLQDTEAFAELQSVIDEMSSATIEFQDSVKPLLDVLNAVFEIRQKNKINEVYQDIQEDKKWHEEKNAQIKELEERLSEIETRELSLKSKVATLAEDKSFFGFGPVKQSAREEISKIENVELPNLAEEKKSIASEVQKHIQELEAGREGGSQDLLAQKKVLMDFLDLTKDENRDRQKALINSAINYVDSSDKRLKSVISTLDKLRNHAEVVGDSNNMLKNIHIIMDESLKTVNEKNKDVKGLLESVKEGESAIEKMTREEKLMEVNEHITRTDEQAIDIANSIGGLTKQAVQIQTYKDTVRNERGSTKRLHLEGVSQMAEQLMSVISAISSAATTESRSVAANNLENMAQTNQSIISQEVIKNATNVNIEAEQISKLVGELADYGDVLNASSEIASEGYGKMRDTVDAIRKVSESVQGAIDDFVSDRADAGIATGSQNDKQSKESSNSEKLQNPFDKLGSL